MGYGHEGRPSGASKKWHPPHTIAPYHQNYSKTNYGFYSGKGDVPTQLAGIGAEIHMVNTDIRERQHQKNSLLGLMRSYGSYIVAPAGAKGKFFSFGGRKSRHATLGDYRSAESQIDPITQHITKLQSRKVELQAREQVLIKQYQAEQAAIAARKRAAEIAAAKIEARKKLFKGGHPAGYTTRSPKPRTRAGTTKRYMSRRR